jgi:hypothetical protein
MPMQECLYVSAISDFLQDERVISFQGLDIPMELNKEDGYWRATLDLADGRIDFIRFLPSCISCFVRHLSLSI